MKIKIWSFCSLISVVGDARAQYKVGFMYANGQGVIKDYKEAVKWYKVAAEKGLSAAQYNLGVMFGNGHGVQQDDKKAVQWFRRAAAQGSHLLSIILG